MISKLVSNSVLKRTLNQTVALAWRQRGGLIKNSINRYKDFSRDMDEVKDRAVDGSINDIFTLGMTQMIF